jgi:hypothetical protein
LLSFHTSYSFGQKDILKNCGEYKIRYHLPYMKFIPDVLHEPEEETKAEEINQNFQLKTLKLITKGYLIHF